MYLGLGRPVSDPLNTPNEDIRLTNLWYLHTTMLRIKNLLTRLTNLQELTNSIAEHSQLIKLYLRHSRDNYTSLTDES